MNTILYLQRKGLISITVGILVLLGMIGASYSVRFKNPEETNIEFISTPPSIPILRVLTQWGENIETYETEDDVFVDEDLLPSVRDEDQAVTEVTISDIKKCKSILYLGQTIWGEMCMFGWLLPLIHIYYRDFWLL